METNNIDVYLEHLRQEYAQAQRVRLEQRRIASNHCAKLCDLANEIEKIYIAILWQQAELNKQRGNLAGVFTL